MFVCFRHFLSSLPLWHFAAYVVYLFLIVLDIILIILGHVIKTKSKNQAHCGRGIRGLRERLCIYSSPNWAS